MEKNVEVLDTQRSNTNLDAESFDALIFTLTGDDQTLSAVSAAIRFHLRPVTHCNANSANLLLTKYLAT